jgi:ABC-type Zn uptake system ZnuABC Zn-binding protein ZnuA
MNRLIVVALLALALLISCSSPVTVFSETLDVVVSTQILGDVVSVIGADFIELTILIPPDSDPHAFEPAPQDAARLTDADLIFVNGLNLEKGLNPLLETEGLNIIPASDGIIAIESVGEEFEGGDPHVWMNPLNVKVWVENIAEALAAADPAHAEDFRANAQAYRAELDALDAWAAQQLSLIPAEARVLVTDHESLGYFAYHYDFEIVGALIPSLSTVSEPSAGELAQLEDAISQHGVKAIFISSSVNPSLADRVAADTGVMVIALYTESLSALTGPVPTYLDLIRFDVAAIVAALQ